MVQYVIHFSNRVRVRFKMEGCFSALYSLPQAVAFKDELASSKLLITKDYRRVDRTTVEKIVYHPRISSILTEEEITEYINYLYYHRAWNQWILNRDPASIRTRGLVVTADCYGEQMIGTLYSFRYLDEKPLIVRTWYLLHKKHGVNPDIAFMISHFVRSLNPGGFVSYNSNGHSILSTSTVRVGNVISFATDFPYKPLSEVKYNDILDPRRLNSWMVSSGGTGALVSDIIKSCREEIYSSGLKADILFSKINEIQEEVDKINAKKKKESA